MKKKIRQIFASLLVAIMILTAVPLSGLSGLELDLSWLDFSTKASAASYSGTLSGTLVTWSFDTSTGTLTLGGTGDMLDQEGYSYPWYKYQPDVKSIIIGNGVTYISKRAFETYLNLTSLTIGNSVQRIGQEAFFACGDLTYVKIPDSVTVIGHRAFSGCEKLNVSLGKNITSIDHSAFAGCNGITSITIPDGVKNLGSYAFSECKGLKSVTLGNGITNIDINTFDYCSNLEKVTIGKNVTNIDDCAFRGCESLESITIPDSVKTIGKAAFYCCYSLEKLTLGNGVVSLEDAAFRACHALTSINIPANLTTIGSRVFDDNYNIKRITVDPANKAFSTDAYGVLFNKDKTKLILYPAGHERSNYPIPDSVTEISEYAFNCSDDLFNVTIPDSVKIIGYASFQDSGIVMLDLPDSVTKIYDYAFDYCYNLSSITIPGAVTSIGNYAFRDCSSLTEINIPKSVTVIGDNAFENCENFTTVNYTGSVADWFEIDFGIGNDFLSTYPLSGLEINFVDTHENYYGAMITQCGDDLMFAVEEESGELRLYGTGDMFDWETEGPPLFSNFWDSIRTVKIEKGITGIADYAFDDCENLTDVYFDGTREEWSKVNVGSNNEDFLNANFHFKETENTVTYNYANNGGTSATKTSAAVKEGSAIDLTPTATKSGWTFVGWNTDKNATTGLTSLKMGTSDVTLYAIYKKTLTATFIDYSGTTKKTRTATTTIYNKATSGTVSAPTQNAYTGWTKRGWTTSTSASASAVSSYSISADTIFYGLYSRTLTLSYNKNGGNTTPSSQTGTQYANSYSITAYKNPSFTLAGAISKADSAFTGWAANSTSGTKYNAGANIIISADTTMYATWQAVVNVYNLGEETYNFKNFGDNHSPNGHCFGMSMTSSAYYLGELDVKNIGISKSSQLYTVSDTSAVRQPICYLQNVQGYYSNQSIVAGGTYYLKKIYNINSDWQAVVNYVKNHKYDNTGNLQIGFRNIGGKNDVGSSGGHAINFLRYEVVNGQERIYAYDNNYPNVETYFYMSNGNVYQAPKSTFGDGATIDCIALRDVSKFMKLAENYDASRYIYGDSDMITIEGAIAYPMECGDDSYTMFELPEGTDQIIINPLVDNATFDYMGTDYSFGKVDDDTYGVFVLSGNDASAGGSSAQLNVMKKHGKVNSVSIDNFSLNYKASTTVSPSINVDSGVKYTVSYSSSNDSVATVDSNGKVTAKGTGSATITVTVTDEYGNTVSDTCEVSVSYQWWEWIIVIVLFGWIWY